MEQLTRQTPHQTHMRNEHTDAEVFGGLVLAVALCALGAFLLLTVL